jgi:O-antigen/teichoic acid export membrane protein
MLNFFSMVVSTLNGVVTGLHRGYVVQSLGFFGSLLQLYLVFVLVPTHGLLGFAWALIIHQLFLAGCGWVTIYIIGRRASIIPLNFAFDVAKEITTLGMKIQLVSVLNNIFEPTVKLLLSGTASRAEQGAFELAFKTVTLIRSAVVAGVTASRAAFSNLVLTDLQACRNLYRKTNRLVLVCSAGAMSSLLLCSWMISTAWLGYVDGAFLWFFALCCVGYLFNMMSAPAYNLGLAFGDLSGNLKGVSLTLFLLMMVSFVFKDLMNAHALVAVAALCLALGSNVTKVLNERLLQNAN